MNYFLLFLFSAYSNNISEDGHQVSAEQIMSFSTSNSVVSVHSYNFEATQSCPKVYLSGANSRTLDKVTLCDINVDGYPPLSAHTDVAFIHFKNYRVDDQALFYDVDLALKRGGAFMARCRLPVQEDTLGAPACYKLNDGL